MQFFLLFWESSKSVLQLFSLFPEFLENIFFFLTPLAIYVFFFSSLFKGCIKKLHSFSKLGCRESELGEKSLRHSLLFAINHRKRASFGNLGKWREGGGLKRCRKLRKKCCIWKTGSSSLLPFTCYFQEFLTICLR